MNMIQRSIRQFCSKLIQAKTTVAFKGEYEALCIAVYTCLFIMKSTEYGLYKQTDYDVCIKDVKHIAVSGRHSDDNKMLFLYVYIKAKRYTHSYTINLFDYKASMNKYPHPYNIGMKRNHDFRMLYNLLVGVD